MKPLLNTLFVNTQGAHLTREGLTVAVSMQGEIRTRIPIHILSGIVCFGVVSATPFLFQLAAEHGVSVAFCTEFGRFIGRMQGPISGNVVLRRKQYRAADDRLLSTTLARSIVSAKINNGRCVLQRASRDSCDLEKKAVLDFAALRLRRTLDTLTHADSVDQVRGFEGEAANLYFGVLDQLVTAEKEHFFFRGRSRRPPLDNLNALLSFLYTLLANDTVAALETVGLDPQVGFLHRERPGRPSLALDLMEELRAPVADRLALRLINRRQIEADGFHRTESGGVTMNEATRRIVLTEWQLRKAEEVTHPFLNETIPLGLIPYLQALLLARYLRGDLDGYPPYFWR